jgi:hypothetical protein
MEADPYVGADSRVIVALQIDGAYRGPHLQFLLEDQPLDEIEQQVADDVDVAEGYGRNVAVPEQGTNVCKQL